MKTLLASLALLASVVTAQADGSADDIVQNLYPLKVLDASWDGNQFYLVVLDNGQDGLSNHRSARYRQVIRCGPCDGRRLGIPRARES